MLVREVMTSQAVTVTPDTSVKEALALLERHHITAAPVLDDPLLDVLQGEQIGVAPEVQ